MSSSTENLPLYLSGRMRERRRRLLGANVARHVQEPLPDLLTVPGIGPRNMEKLVSKGIAKLAELKQLYRDKVLSPSHNWVKDNMRKLQH